MNKDEKVEISARSFIEEALEKNRNNLEAMAVGSEEWERLVKERDLLIKSLLEVIKRDQELYNEYKPKWKRVLDDTLNVGKIVVDIGAKIFQVGGSLAFGLAIVQISRKEGFISADEMKGLTWADRLLTRN